jgi:hypothetical protein
MLPAALATILLFLDQQITAVIVNRKENKLKVSGCESFGHCCLWRHDSTIFTNQDSSSFLISKFLLFAF